MLEETWEDVTHEVTVNEFGNLIHGTYPVNLAGAWSGSAQNVILQTNKEYRLRKIYSVNSNRPAFIVEQKR